jgi:osmotically-inducible protein OsmY
MPSLCRGIPAQCSTNTEQISDNSPSLLTEIAAAASSSVPGGPEFATCISTMARLYFVVAAGALAVSVGCSANAVTQEREPDVSIPPQAVNARPISTGAPQNPADRSIRRDLNLAIARDADLRNREITFMVANGDVSVSGIVRTEEERRKINDLAMNIGGVKSVANALRVAE